MKIATLAIIVQGDKVLLGRKKTGEIGGGTFNGPGGKCEDNESPLECVVRETEEELGIQLHPASLEEVAHITFLVGGKPDFEVHVFRTDSFEGVPQETADMTPSWHPSNALPFADMLESDRAWFLKAVKGEKFRATVYYKERASGFEKIEFYPYSDSST